MLGHVFVMRGDVTHLRCDARLVPVHDHHLPKTDWLRDRELDVLDASSKRPPVGWREDRRTWLLGAADDHGPALWVTKVGLDEDRDIEWAMESVRAFLEQAYEHAMSVTARPAGRAMPLLATHLVASGPKNAPWALGEIVKLLLEVVRCFVETHRADVAIVVRDDAEYAALQHARLVDRGYWAELPESLLDRAEQLASEALRGGLCVLTGSGVSMGAGLPNWKGLLTSLADHAGIAGADRDEILNDKSNSPLHQASAILQHYEDRTAFNQQIAALCEASRVALAHGLLANLPVSEYVTLNFDTLLEEAASGAGRVLDVLPHGRTSTGHQWILKLHGCRTRPDEIVLTEDDFDTYDHRREAFAGIVQALLVTRHMLFVGFGLTDPNIARLVRAVERAVRHDAALCKQNLGTVLTLDDPSLLCRMWMPRFRVETVRSDQADSGDIATRARLLDMTLDRLAALTTNVSAHVLDPRFDGLLDDGERAAREIAEEFADRLAQVAGDTLAAKNIVDHLRSMGLPLPAPKA